MLTDEQKAIVADRKQRRMRVTALTLSGKVRQSLVDDAVKAAESPKPIPTPDFDRNHFVYAGREISPYYFEGEERRVYAREKVYQRDEANHITRFDTLREFFNPLTFWQQLFGILRIIFAG